MNKRSHLLYALTYMTRNVDFFFNPLKPMHVVRILF